MGNVKAVTERTSGEGLQGEPLITPARPESEPAAPAAERTGTTGMAAPELERDTKAAAEPVTAAEVLEKGRSLRAGLMWTLVGALVLGLLLTVGLNPKTGAYYFGALMFVLGTARAILPGAPFGISARSKLFDVLFFYALSAAVIFLASTSSALRCTEGLFC